MKKMLSIAFVLILALSLFACGEGKSESQSSLSSQEATGTTPSKQDSIIGMWEGDWIGGSRVEFQFLDNGEFYCSTYYGDSSNSTSGTYWMEDNEIHLDTGKVYPVQSVQNGLLKLETSDGVYTLRAFCI